MDNLDTKAEQLHETSQMVGRRADRLVQTKSWTPPKAVFAGNFGLRHVATGKYLACLHSELFLVNQFNPASCTFGVHQRPGGAAAARLGHPHGGIAKPRQPQVDGTELFDGSAAVRGRQHGTPRRVSSGRGGGGGDSNKNDDKEHPWNKNNTRLLCASAGWGQGGYLRVHPATFAVSIGGATVADGKNAARWCFISQDGGDDGGGGAAAAVVVKDGRSTRR